MKVRAQEFGAYEHTCIEYDSDILVHSLYREVQGDGRERRTHTLTNTVSDPL
jgi:hypothetical protein